MANDLYRNSTDNDEKVKSQTIKNSIGKCAHGAVFLGKKTRYFKFKEEKIASELNQNYKQLTFKTNEKSLTKQESLFETKVGVISKEEGPGRVFNHICYANKDSQSIGSTRTLMCQTISTLFPNSGK